MKGPLTSPSAWAERYENLRRYVLEGQRLLQSQPLGLALWVAKGMAGWMKYWNQCTQASAASPSAVPLPRATSPGPWQQQLTLLLAQMTLEQLQPASL